MNSGLFRDVVVRQGSFILKLFSSENKSLLDSRDSFFILDLSFEFSDCVGRFNFDADCLTSQGFDEDLHSTSQSQDQVDVVVFADSVVFQGFLIVQLFSTKDQSLVFLWDSFSFVQVFFQLSDCFVQVHVHGQVFTA